jgi:hypothetical protein
MRGNCIGHCSGSRSPQRQEWFTGALLSIEQLANCVIEVLTDPSLFRSIRVQARKTILDQYDLARICLPRMMAFIQKAGLGKG